MKLSIIALLLCLAVPAHGEEVFKVYAGANAVSWDGAAAKLPSSFELGGNARASLSPHISLVGSAYKGINRDYRCYVLYHTR